MSVLLLVKILTPEEKSNKTLKHRRSSAPITLEEAEMAFHSPVKCSSSKIANLLSQSHVINNTANFIPNVIKNTSDFFPDVIKNTAIFSPSVNKNTVDFFLNVIENTAVPPPPPNVIKNTADFPPMSLGILLIIPQCH